MVPLMVLIVGARAELLRNGQNKGSQLEDLHLTRGQKSTECPREIRTKKFMFMLFYLPWFLNHTKQKIMENPTRYEMDQACETL